MHSKSCSKKGDKMKTEMKSKVKTGKAKMPPQKKIKARKSYYA